MLNQVAYIFANMRRNSVALGLAGFFIGMVLCVGAFDVATAQTEPGAVVQVSGIGERIARLETNMENVKESIQGLEKTLSSFFFMTFGAFLSGLVGAGGLVYGLKTRSG